MNLLERTVVRVLAQLDRQADADCGCPWQRDDVGEGQWMIHDQDTCWGILAADLRGALDPSVLFRAGVPPQKRNP